MTQSLIRARIEREYGSGRRRKRHLKKSGDVMLALFDKLLIILDEAEHDMRIMTREYPPHILAGYLADAADTRREIESQRRDILTRP
jgi:hypothetical protein